MLRLVSGSCYDVNFAMKGDVKKFNGDEIIKFV